MTLKIVRLILLALLLGEAAVLVFGPQAGVHQEAIAKALAANDKVDWWDDAALGVRQAAWLNVAVLALLLAGSAWWARPFKQSSAVVNSLAPSASPKWFWPALLVALLACLAARLPLASKSLWWDESWVMTQAGHGKWRLDTKNPEKLKFQAHDWKRCAFYYQKPTNHAPVSLAQKASLSVWRAVTGSKREEFSDLAARAPSLIFSCGAILLLGGLLRAWGRPGVGVTAAFALALHPWAVRYGVDARGYSLVIPLCISALWAATQIIGSGGRRVWPWIWFGLTEFFWLWAYPTDVVIVALVNLVIFALLVVHHKDAQDRWTALLRFGVANVLAALCFLQMFLPNLKQAGRWAGNETVAAPFTEELLKSTLSQMFLGVEHRWTDAEEAAGLVSSYAGVSPFGLTYNMLGALAVGLLFIAVFNRRQYSIPLSRAFRLLLAAPLVGAALFTVITVVLKSYYYPRFIIASLPCVIVVVCLVLAGSWKKPFGRIPHIIATVLVILAIGPFWYAQDKVLATRPYAPLHGVAEFVRMDAAQQPKPPLIVCYGLGREVLPMYEPRALSAVTASELEELVRQAKAEQRPLYAIYGYNIFNRQMVPEGFKLLDDKTLFAEAAAFPAIDPEFYFRVLKLVPSSS